MSECKKCEADKLQAQQEQAKLEILASEHLSRLLIIEQGMQALLDQLSRPAVYNVAGKLCQSKNFPRLQDLFDGLAISYGEQKTTTLHQLLSNPLKFTSDGVNYNRAVEAIHYYFQANAYKSLWSL